jgi:ribonuclease HI/pterin-4a-carbinolamine dehydratase
MWKELNNQLYRKFVFTDFDEAFSFMTKVSELANRLNHHPKWTNEWNVVEIWLTTHDSNSEITDKDREMAANIDKIIDQPKINKVGIKLFTDGGSRGNPGPSASGFVILDGNDDVLFAKGIYLGIMTNNQAEYLALKYGLEKLLDMGIEELSVYMDSLLIVNQMNGKFKIKNQDLLVIFTDIKNILLSFKKVTFTHVPREKNKLADAEVNKALDKAIA